MTLILGLLAFLALPFWASLAGRAHPIEPRQAEKPIVPQPL